MLLVSLLSPTWLFGSTVTEPNSVPEIEVIIRGTENVTVPPGCRVGTGQVTLPTNVGCVHGVGIDVPEQSSAPVSGFTKQVGVPVPCDGQVNWPVSGFT
jgi:hypothetical protein